jgi:16S rRNA (cytosine967-C5)-methyltransferase
VKRKLSKLRPPEGARKAAWRIVVDWEAGGTALEALRDGYFRRACPDPRDRALITELTQGTARHRLFLDHAVRSNLERPDLTLPQPVLTALRLGAYQLIHLHKIPAHAAVKETVQVIKDSRYRRFAPLVNAILRKIADKGPPPIPAFTVDPQQHIELATSTPQWLVQNLARCRGYEEALSIFQALNRTPPLTLRVNTRKTSREGLLKALEEHGVAAAPGKLSASAVILLQRLPIWELPPFKEGLCTVQDEGAQLVAGLLTPAPGLRTLDACAAPGGKISHLVELVPNHGLMAAADKSFKRLHMMADNLKRLGITSIQLIAADLTVNASPFREKTLDRVLLDAPCSGTGVLRRHPEGKWKKDPGTIGRITSVQRDLLVSAGRSLKNGGRVLYTTCSLLAEENEEVVDQYLSDSRGMTRIDLRDLFPHMREDIFTHRGELRLWPHIHNCDGFYASLLEKKI